MGNARQPPENPEQMTSSVATPPAAQSQIVRFNAPLHRMLQFTLSACVVLVFIVYVGHVALLVTDGVALGPAVAGSVPESLRHIGNVLQGNWGLSTAATSTANPIDTATVLPQIVARSLGLLAVSLILAVLIGLPLGIWAALRRHSNVSLVILLISIVGVSAPSFFVALILQRLAIQWTRQMGGALVPMGGFGWDRHLVLPALVLAARPLAQITRMTFLTLGHVLEQDYIRTAVSKGLSRPRIIAFHVMRNGAVPILTTIGLSLRLALSSLPVVELFFGWPGAGFMLLKAIAGHDLNLAIALLLIFGLIFVLLSMLLEVGYFWADPRLRTLSALPASRGRSVRLAFDGWRAGSSLGSRLAALRDWVAGLREEFAWASWTASWQSLRGRAQGGGFARIQTVRTRRRGIANWALWLGTLIIAALGVVLLFGPQLARHSPYTTQGMEYVDGVFSIPPFAADAVYPWGTDVLGRDIQSLVLAGARQTLALAALAVGLRMVIGVALGLAAGWWSASPLDRLIGGVSSVMAAFPTLILVMLLILILGIRGGFRPFVLGLGIVGWGEIMQFVRGEVIALRPKPFLESAVAVGAPTPRIIGRHIMPNLLPAFVSLIALELGAVLMLLGELGFVGIFIGGGAFAELVIDAPKYHYSDVPEWGALLSNVRLYARVYPWTAIYPALGFFVAILGFNLLGEGVRRLVDAGALHLDRLANRFVLVGALVAVAALTWVGNNGGAVAYYREQAVAFSGTRAFATVAALADPALDGRSLGSPGLTAAAHQIEGAFVAAGLQPGGVDGTYFQPRARDYQQLDAPPYLTVDDGGVQPLYHQDFREFAGSYRIEGDSQGPVYALAAGVLTGSNRGGSAQLPRALARLDLSDAYAANGVMLLLDPEDVDRFDRLPHAGVLVVAPDDTSLAIGADTAFARRVTLPSRDPVSRTFGGRDVGQSAPVFWITQVLADRLLADTGTTVDQLRQETAQLAVDEVRIVETGQTVAMRAQGAIHENVPAAHVIGHLPAVEGQNLGGQLIMVLAKYDAPPLNPDGLAYPGANDNASGVAVMLEAIRTMQETNYQPYKTFLFVAYSGEGWEKGVPVMPLDVLRFLDARPGFANNFQLEAVVELRGLGGRSDGGGRLAVETSGSLRLAELFVDAAQRANVPAHRTGGQLDMAVVFDQAQGAQRGQDAPQVGLQWDGWHSLSNTPLDTLETVVPATLTQAGRAITLGLMVLGRETTY